MTVRDIDAFMTYLASQLPSGASLSASAVRVALGDLLDTVRDKMFEHKGTFVPASATLSNGTGRMGDVYKASAAGSRNFGAGSITFAVGDWVWYDGSVWDKVSKDGTGGVAVDLPPPVRTTGAVLAPNSENTLVAGGTYTLSAAVDNDYLTIVLPSGASATVTGIGSIANTTTRYAVFLYRHNGSAYEAVGSNPAYASSVVDKAARNAVAASARNVGEVVTVATNGVSYLVSGGQFTTPWLETSTLNAASANLLSELEPSQSVRTQHNDRRRVWDSVNSQLRYEPGSRIRKDFVGLFQSYATTPRAAFSMVRTSNTYTGPVFTVKRTGDNASRSFTFSEMESGDLVRWVKAAGTLSSGLVSRWTDHLGNFIETTTESEMPVIVEATSLDVVHNPENGMPALLAPSGSTKRLSGTLGVAATANHTMLTICKPLAAPTDFHSVVECGSSDFIRHQFVGTQGFHAWVRGNSGTDTRYVDSLPNDLKTRYAVSHVNYGSTPEIEMHAAFGNALPIVYASSGTVQNNTDTTAGGTAIQIYKTAFTTFNGYIQAVCIWGVDLRTQIDDIISQARLVYQ